MDFSALTPASAPTRTGQHTVVVGEKLPTDPARMLVEFTRSFESTAAADVHGHEPALIVNTSGSTGKPKQTVLSAAALQASGEATAEATGSPGAQWLLALPVHYVAGAQVIARSALAGTTPTITDSVAHGGPFSAADFLAASERLSAHHRMTSLVPTQLHRLLEEAEKSPAAVSDILEAMRSFTAILLGGAPASASLLSACRDHRINVVTTYGSAETSGGCVYNSRPLPTVQVAIQDPDDHGIGRVWLGGKPLADGYLNDPTRTAASFFIDEHGTRWYLTDDRGCFTDGTLTIEGRADDVLITGGIKVSARRIVERLTEHPGVKEAVVAGVAHPRWGQAVAAMVSVKRGPAEPAPQELSRFVAESLGKPAAPKIIETVDELPALSTGKPDRLSIHRLLAQKSSTIN